MIKALLLMLLALAISCEDPATDYARLAFDRLVREQTGDLVRVSEFRVVGRSSEEDGLRVEATGSLQLVRTAYWGPVVAPQTARIEGASEFDFRDFRAWADSTRVSDWDSPTEIALSTEGTTIDFRAQLVLPEQQTEGPLESDVSELSGRVSFTCYWEPREALIPPEASFCEAPYAKGALKSGREQAEIARGVLRSTLKNLASQEEIFHARHGTYTNALDSLDLDIPAGVTIRIDAKTHGWSALSRHNAWPTVCAFFWGDDIEPLSPAKDPGELACTS